MPDTYFKNKKMKNTFLIIIISMSGFTFIIGQDKQNTDGYKLDDLGAYGAGLSDQITLLKNIDKPNNNIQITGRWVGSYYTKVGLVEVETKIDWLIKQEGLDISGNWIAYGIFQDDLNGKILQSGIIRIEIANTVCNKYGIFQYDSTKDELYGTIECSKKSMYLSPKKIKLRRMSKNVSSSSYDYDNSYQSILPSNNFNSNDCQIKCSVCQGTGIASYQHQVFKGGSLQIETYKDKCEGCGGDGCY
ncbi:MAG: hypothetical protein AAF673_00690 [Pseudomonadota bacterium]